jgi:hypothetical protein
MTLETWGKSSAVFWFSICYHTGTEPQILFCFSCCFLRGCMLFETAPRPFFTPYHFPVTFFHLILSGVQETTSGLEKQNCGIREKIHRDSCRGAENEV